MTQPGPAREASPASVAVDRALQILEWMAEGEAGARSIRDIARSLGMSKTAVHRLLETLAQRRWVIQDQAGSYRLGTRALHVGAAVLRQIDLLGAIRPSALRLRDATHETVFATVLDVGQLLIVDKFESPSALRFARPIGSRSIAHANAAGKVLLAALPESELEAYLAQPLDAATPRTITDVAALRRELADVRARGYASNDEEGILGVVSLGAAVRDHTGAAVAGLSVSGPRDRMRPQITSLVEALLAAAHEASEALGYRR
ncbi:MAG: IclR family transcriptional regulator [Chloroflexi bacterium]|nr:IclR family transcriptional regulator [Chloroflexota bacterium]